MREENVRRGERRGERIEEKRTGIIINDVLRQFGRDGAFVASAGGGSVLLHNLNGDVSGHVNESASSDHKANVFRSNLGRVSGWEMRRKSYWER